MREITNFSRGRACKPTELTHRKSKRPVYSFPGNPILTFFVENRRSRTTGSICGRSFCIQCSVDSKDSPQSCSFSRLKELGLIHTKVEMSNGTGNFQKKRDAFHSTKIFGNSGSKSNGTEIFRKFVSKISVHLSRLSFFLEIWKFWKLPVPFDISTRFESTPVPLVVKSYKMAGSLSSQLHWMQNDLP